MSDKFQVGDNIVYESDGDLAKVISPRSFIWITFNGSRTHEYCIKKLPTRFETSVDKDRFRKLTPLELAML